MALVETHRTTTTELGRGSEQTEVYGSGSSSTTRGAQTTTKTQANPALAVTRAVETPEAATTRQAPVHVGIEFAFTLSFKGRAKKE